MTNKEVQVLYAHHKNNVLKNLTKYPTSILFLTLKNIAYNVSGHGGFRKNGNRYTHNGENLTRNNMIREIREYLRIKN